MTEGMDSEMILKQVQNDRGMTEGWILKQVRNDKEDGFSVLPIKSMDALHLVSKGYLVVTKDILIAFVRMEIGF